MPDDPSARIVSHGYPMPAAPVLVLLAVFGVLVAGCSDGPGREYAVPDRLCGIPVAESLLAPLLPPGKKLEQEDSIPQRESATPCNVYVDGNVVITVSDEWHDKLAVPADAALGYTKSKPSAIVAGDAAVAWDYGAVATQRCKSDRSPGGAEYYEITLDAGGSPGKGEKLKKAVTRLMKPYMRAIADELGCRG